MDFSILLMKVSIWNREWIFKGFFLLFLWCLQSNFAALTGQTFMFQHITEKEGLPSTYLYGVIQDKAGHIWVTGESGVLWYNGQSYYRPEVQDELNDEVIRFFKGDSKRVWMQDLAGRILFFEDGKIHTLEEVGPNAIYRYVTVYNDPNGDTWISNTEGVFIYKTDIDSLIRLQVDTSNHNLVSVKAFGQIENGKTILFTRFGYHIFEGEQSLFIPFEGGENLSKLSMGFQKDGKPFLVINNKIYFFNLKTRKLEPIFEPFNEYFKVGIIDVFEDSNGWLWFSTSDGLLLIKENEKGKPEITKHLRGEIMGGATEDSEGDLWFITGQNGLFKLPSKQVKIFNDNGLDQQIRFINENAKGNLVLGFDNNQFKVLDKSFNVIHDQKLFDQNYRLYDYALNKNGDQYIITSRGFVRFDPDNNLVYKSYRWSLKSGAFTSDGKLWLATGEFFGYTLVSDGSKTFPVLKKRTYSLWPVSDDKIWVGTTEGLFLYENETCTKIQNPDLHYDIRDIKMVGKDHLLLATQKNGLYYYQPSTDSILFHFSMNTGLSNNNCSKVLVDEKYFWLGTKKGINRIKRSDYSVSLIGLDQGLPSNEVNDIYKCDGRVYVATNRGMAFFSENIDLTRMPPLLQITNIKIDERDTTFQDEFILNYSQNNIKVEFSAITFKDAQQAEYQYKMDGLDKDWIQSGINIAQYPSLPPGQYTFFVKTKTVNSGWSEEQKINFHIAAPYWKSFWFYLLMGVLISGISFLIFKEVDRRKSVIRDLKASQLTALRAQMNPHFIFNALNSIQEFVVNKNTRSANRYLAQFARLMRNILNASDKGLISLSKEIESLNLYLSLEALRLGDSFEYTLKVDEEIDSDTLYIPPMLIQPFVENAIKHGLMHQNRDKKLYIGFSIHNQSLICELEDNGIGRKKSAEIRKLNPNIYPSKATSLTNERIKLFNAMANNSLTVEVIDLEDSHKKPIGTKVIITINSNFKGIQ